MVDELAVTNEIWRKWDEMKVQPISWQQLWEQVRQRIKKGEEPSKIIEAFIEIGKAELLRKREIVEIIAEEMPTKYAKVEEEVSYILYPRLPWPYPEPEAIVEEAELKTFAEWLLAAVKRVWKTKKSEIHWEWIIEPTDKGVLVGLRGVSRPHELFPASLIEKHNPDKLKDLFAGRTLEGYVEAAKVRTLETFKGVTFYFETTAERDKAREFLARHNFYFPDGPGISLTDIEDPDYMLELLAYEGFDTSKIMVER